MYGPRATGVFCEPNVFQTALLPGESASVGFYVTPNSRWRRDRVGASPAIGSDRPESADDVLSWTFAIAPAPPIPPILRVRKVRTDFFDQTSSAEVEIDQAALNRLAPFTTFYLERSSNLHDWEYLKLVGWTPLAPVTFTDHGDPGVTMRAYRLRTPWKW